VRFLLVAGDGDLHRRRGRKKDEAAPDPPAAWSLLQRQIFV